MYRSVLNTGGRTLSSWLTNSTGGHGRPVAVSRSQSVNYIHILYSITRRGASPLNPATGDHRPPYRYTYATWSVLWDVSGSPRRSYRRAAVFGVHSLTTTTYDIVLRKGQRGGDSRLIRGREARTAKFTPRETTGRRRWILIKLIVTLCTVQYLLRARGEVTRGDRESSVSNREGRPIHSYIRVNGRGCRLNPIRRTIARQRAGWAI